MERLARIVAYAVLACGASFACLLLFSAPAQADGSGPGLSLLSGGSAEDEGPLESVGSLAGDTTRAATEKTTDVVRDVVAVAPVVKPVVEPITDKATEVVEHTTDAVATEVEKVASEVDKGVDQLVTPIPVTTPGGPPPPEQPAEEEPSAPGPGEPSAEESKAQDSPRPAVTRDRNVDRGRADAPQRSDRDRAATPAKRLDVGATGVHPDDALDIRVPDLALGDSTADDADEAGASAVQATGPWGTPASCDHCAAGAIGSSGDLPTLHGLVGSHLSTSPGFTAPGIGRAELGPAVTFACPDASPD